MLVTGTGEEVCFATGQNESCCHECTNNACNGWLSGQAGARVYFCHGTGRANRKKSAIEATWALEAMRDFFSGARFEMLPTAFVNVARLPA